MKKIYTTLCCFLFAISLLNGQGNWTQIANYGGGSITEARAFAIGNFGYVGGPNAVLWQYDPVNDIWTQMASMTGPGRLSPFAFSIGSKGYLGTGGGFNDFYEYDPALNAWTAKANFGGTGREGAVGISINGKGYAGTGGNYLNDWWEYDPVLDAWTQKANLAGPGRYHAGAFAIGSKGYVCSGFNGNFYNDLWEYDPALNTWTAKMSMPGVTRDRPVGLATATKGYLLTGWSGTLSLNDSWEYDPVTDSWTSLPSVPPAGRYNACGFVINNVLHIGSGVGGTGDFWKYGNLCSSAATSQSCTCAGTCDGTASITAPGPGGVVSYLWSDGQITAIALNLCAGIYTASVTDTSGCVSITQVTVTEPDSITISAAITPPTCFGDPDGSVCVTGSPGPVTVIWGNGDTNSCQFNLPAGVYTVIATNPAGCSNSASVTVTQPSMFIVNTIGTNASCGTCADGSANAQLFGGVPPMVYQWSNGGTQSFINNLLPGFYSCCVTDSHGCIACDSIEITAPIGLNDLSGSNISISPNPVINELFVDGIPPGSNHIEFKLYDSAGKRIVATPLMQNERISIPMESLDAGIYFLEISSAQVNRTFRVMKY